MEQNTYIEFRKLRHFSDKFSATFDFLKIAFKPLGRALLFIAGPIVAISSVGYVLYMQQITGVLTSLSLNENVGPGTMFSELSSFLGLVFIFSILSLIAFLLVFTITIEYINIYTEKKSPDISVNEVWDRVRQSFGKVLGSAIVLSLLYVVLVFVFAGILYFFAESPGMIALFSIALFFGFIYMIIALSLFYNIMLNEKRSFAEFGTVFQRCFILIRGKWWSTFGLLFIASVLLGIVGMLLSIPAGAGQVADMFQYLDDPEGMQEAMFNQPPWVIAYNGVVMFIRSLLQAFVYIALTFQYFNLVERNEASGLLGQIQNIPEGGQNQFGSGSTGDSEKDESY